MAWNKRKPRAQFYGTKAWQRLRRAKLDANPMCEVCERGGRAVIASTVDHIVAVSMGGQHFPPLDKLLALCARCHKHKTLRHDHPNASGERGMFAGCDTNGNPLDPFCAWNTD